MKRTIESLLELLATHGGTIESTASLNINDIDQAKASGRLYVDENSLGYVWMPSVNDMFPETEDQIKQFEKWFPLDVELPKELENLDWMKKKKSPDHLLPDGYAEEGESEHSLSFQDVIEARIKYFNSKHHTFESCELQQALDTIRRLVPPIQFKIGVQPFPPIELKNLQNHKIKKP